MLADIWRFTVAVVRHWQGYATGGVVMALLAVYDAAGGTKWVAASLQEPPSETSFGDRSPVFIALEKGREAAIAEHRAAAFAWLAEVKMKVEADFGPAMGVRFNLGKPTGIALGEEAIDRGTPVDVVVAERRDAGNQRLPLEQDESSDAQKEREAFDQPASGGGGVAFQAPRFLWPIQYRRIPRAMAKLASAMSG